jgi:hypothetical protein
MKVSIIKAMGTYGNCLNAYSGEGTEKNIAKEWTNETLG